MKKNIFIFAPIVAISLSACSLNGVKHQTSEYILSTAYKNDFRILQLTDIHLGDKDDQDMHYKFMDLTIKDANPDLIVVTGDLFSVASKTTAKRFFNYLDGHNVPWTITFGNHDEQCFFSVDWLTTLLNGYGSNCLFKDIQDDNLQGNCNFAINLMKDNKVFEQVIIMDTNRYNYGSYFGYDYVKDEQITWYSDLIDYTKNQNGGTVVPSLLFYHIPLPEINEAWDYSHDGSGRATFEYGEKREKSCPPDYNSGFFNKILEKGSTRAMFFGHDHINNFRCVYKGVTFSYGIHSTDRVYHDEDMMGGQVIIIHDDHSLSYEHIYHTYEQI